MYIERKIFPSPMDPIIEIYRRLILERNKSANLGVEIFYIDFQISKKLLIREINIFLHIIKCNAG